MKRICLTVLVLIFILTTIACSNKGEADVSLPESVHKTTMHKTEVTETKAPVLDMGKEDNTRITIAVNKPDNRFIETAAKKFQKSNPDIVVELKTYTNMGETLTQKTESGATLAIDENTDPWGEKYIKSINTELMSGTGPDIIDTFYVPCGKFADNGFLTDMNQIIQQDTSFDSNNYYENIMFANKYKGGLYSMPVGFSVNLITGKYELPKKAISGRLTLDVFLKTAAEVLKSHGVGGTYVLYDNAENLFSNLLDRNYKAFIKEDTKECDFTSGEFVNLIKTIKEAADKKLLYTSIKHEASDKSWENIYFIGGSQFDMYYLADYKKLKTYGIPSITGESAICTKISEKYGINNNSKSKGAAWKFIKFLVSEEMQTSPEFYLFPINKKAMADKITREKDQIKDTELTADDPIFSKITVYADKDWKISKIVEEETKKFFDGQRTAEDTARIIQGRVDMMVKE